MKRKGNYKAVRVQQVQVAELLPLLVAGCILALDVAKQRFVVALATMAGEVLKLFRFEHPTETVEFRHRYLAPRAGGAAGETGSPSPQNASVARWSTTERNDSTFTGAFTGAPVRSSQPSPTS
jgi:hypothetical protein